MKKTLDINLAGQLFRIDEETLEILRNYLDHVSVRFAAEQGSDEMLQDIEARIAEIFGGGNEPPLLISGEMVHNMIGIMGAPEDYYDNVMPDTGSAPLERKTMYDPNSPSARLGKALSSFFSTFGMIISSVMKVVGIVIGLIFTLTGFTLFFLFTLLIFFNNTPFLAPAVKPAITNSHFLLEIVLNGTPVWLIIILTALVILIPLGALTWLGIKLIFNIRERSRILAIATFLAWAASACALAVLLALQLTGYSQSESMKQKVTVDPVPGTVWIASMKRQSSLDYDRYASAEDVRFFLNSQNKSLKGSVRLRFHHTEDATGEIIVSWSAYGHSTEEAQVSVSDVDFNWKFSGDTLYLDEYYSLPTGKAWSGTNVNIWVRLPEGTIVRMAEGSRPEQFRLYHRNRDSAAWHVSEGRVRQLHD